MDATPHRLEALPGRGHYALTFRFDDGSERTAVLRIDGEAVTVADAGLPENWATGSEPRRAAEEAVVAFDRARASVPATSTLADVDGGWDVMLGNVVLSVDRTPECGAHGLMQADEAGEWRCEECGARAILVG